MCRLYKLFLDESTQAVVVRLGQPDRVYNRFKPDVEFGKTGAGLILRSPKGCTA